MEGGVQELCGMGGEGQGEKFVLVRDTGKVRELRVRDEKRNQQGVGGECAE